MLSEKSGLANRFCEGIDVRLLIRNLRAEDPTGDLCDFRKTMHRKDHRVDKSSRDGFTGVSSIATMTCAKSSLATGEKRELASRGIISALGWLDHLDVFASETLDDSLSLFVKGSSMSARMPLALHQSLRDYPPE